jgi:hypothetical protein
MLYIFFWVIPRRLNFIWRRFGTLCSIFIGGQVNNDISLSHICPRPPYGSLTFYYLLCKWTHFFPVIFLLVGSGYFQAKPSPVWIPKLFSNLAIHLLAYEDGTECSETSAYKIQTPGNYPEENIQHTEHGESLKSRINSTCFRQFLCPSSGVFHCTHSNVIRHTGLLRACEQDQGGSWFRVSFQG